MSRAAFRNGVAIYGGYNYNSYNQPNIPAGPVQPVPGQPFPGQPVPVQPIPSVVPGGPAPVYILGPVSYTTLTPPTTPFGPTSVGVFIIIH